MELALSLNAMATRFELVLHGAAGARLRAAGEAALAEIERIEAQLSFYRSDSEIHLLNRRGAAGPVQVDPRLFRLLTRCVALSAETEGAFDVTIGPLMRAWHFVREGGALPEPGAVAAARAVVGSRHLRFDEEAFAIGFDVAGAEIDLGGYGKGYAVDCAIEVLRESGVTSALLHGGGSSVAAIGAPPGDDAWRIALREPLATAAQPRQIALRDASLSVSTVYGKSFTVEGRTYGHVLDPRSGAPVACAQAAAVTGPSGADCEALSKALLVLGPDWLPAMKTRFPGYEGIVAAPPT